MSGHCLGERAIEALSRTPRRQKARVAYALPSVDSLKKCSFFYGQAGSRLAPRDGTKGPPLPSDEPDSEGAMDVI